MNVNNVRMEGLKEKNEEIVLVILKEMGHLAHDVCFDCALQDGDDTLVGNDEHYEHYEYLLNSKVRVRVM